MTMLALWRRRERPDLLTKRWFVVWAKRLLTFPALLRLRWRASRLRLRGADIGELAIIERSRFEGPGHNLHVGRGAFLGEDCEMVLHDSIHIGEQVVINRRVTILTASHALQDPAWSSYTRPVRIGDRAWIATGATLLPGVTIGRGAVVGAGAVVRSDVPDFALAVGNPAIIRTGARCSHLVYDTAHFAAPTEAWLGPQRSRNLAAQEIHDIAVHAPAEGKPGPRSVQKVPEPE